MNVLAAQGNILEQDADLVVANLFEGVTDAGRGHRRGGSRPERSD